MKKSIKIIILLLAVIIVVILVYPVIKRNYYKNYLIGKSNDINLDNCVVIWKENGIIKSKEYYKDNTMLRKEFDDIGVNVLNQLNDYNNNQQYVYQNTNNYNEGNVLELLNQLNENENVEVHRLENNETNLNAYNSQIVNMLSDLSMKLVSVRKNDEYYRFSFEGKEIDITFVVDAKSGLILKQILYSIENDELNVWEYSYDFNTK